MTERLKTVAFHTPTVPVISNTTVTPFEKEGLADVLARQLVVPTHFGDDLAYLINHQGDIGAEAAAVARADYDVDVVPGVTGMTAVPEYAGLTLHGHDVQLIGDAACQRDIAGYGSNWSDQGLVVVNTEAGKLKGIDVKPVNFLSRTDR
ncbi:hypothetical protein PND17_09600 [Streptococcus thermophilus]|nr:hypothetical protein [Streptococcus thermophilus]WCL61163.1 hypothetical protein PND17_09600 [Streptococcus thermophilus]